jgi:GxxExxY protein
MRQRALLEEALTRSIIGAFYEVYRVLGYGFLEHLYLSALERELLARHHRVARELSVHVVYKGEPIGMQRVDMVVDDLVMIEAKSTMLLSEAAPRQLFNYLHATNIEVGLLLHFGPKPVFSRTICENRLKSKRDASVNSVPSVSSVKPFD